MTATLKVKIIRRPTIKVKVLPKFPANVVATPFLVVTNTSGKYTFSVDYTLLTPGPILDPTTAFIAINDVSAGIYKNVALSSLLTSSLDADLQAIAALSTTGILARTAANTWVLRAITGTANEITITNGDGVAGNPTASLPAALTFTGKTITGGTYSGAVSYNKVIITSPATSATLTLIDGTTLTGPAASGTVMTLGNNETVTGVKTFGAAGNVGKLVVAGTTSGTTVLNATAIASGTLTVPAATDTLIGKATTDILTNKTYDTAGAGNSFSINSLAATANTGTGAVVRATSPALVTPALGTPTALILTSATGLPLSGLNTQAAFTFVGNNTAGAAVPTAVDIATLTSKASPVATDLVMISDQAASGAWKKVTVSSLASAGSVSSIAGNTGAFTLTGLLTNSVNVLQVVAAAKSDQQTGTSTTLAVTPSQAQSHDSAAKAWAYFTLSGTTVTIQASYNVTSIVRNSTGLFTATLTTAFASANFAFIGQAESGTLNMSVTGVPGSRTSSVYQFATVNDLTGAAADPGGAQFCCYGRQ